MVDRGNHIIRKIVINTGAVSRVAGDSSKSGFANGTGTAAEFDNPRRITTDGTNLYVTDTNNNKIRKIVISSGVVTTISTGFDSPSGITSDGISLYSVNKGDSNIRKID